MSDLQFLNYCRPMLPAGERIYEMRVTQVASTAASDPAHERFSSKFRFRLAQPDRAFAPGDIHAVYPAPGSCGAFAATVPHVILNNPALPWLFDDSDDANVRPWLALLLAAGDEIDQIVQNVENEDGNAHHGGGELPARRTITIPGELARSMLPEDGEFRLLAHVQKTSGVERSCLLSTRPPQQGKTNRAYLVSLRDLAPRGAVQSLRLLHTWQFTVETQSNSKFRTSDFERVFSKEVLDFGPLTLPDADIESGSNWAVVGKSRIRRGFVPLARNHASGTRDIAWYRGPLVPMALGDTGPQSPSRSSAGDPKVVERDVVSGIADISVAAAYEIGRLLALGDPTFVQDLLFWKRGRLRKAAREGGDAAGTVLPCRPANLDRPFPVAFLERLAKLELVPFRYLVPDPRMLPSNALRAFRFDREWIYRMLQGALAVAEVGCRCDHGREEADAETRRLAETGPGPIGVLLRSEAATTWKQMKIEFRAPTGHIIIPHVVRPSPGVLMAIANMSNATSVVFRLGEDQPHFNYPDDAGTLTKGWTSSSALAANHVVFGHEAHFYAPSDAPDPIGILT